MVGVHWMFRPVATKNAEQQVNWLLLGLVQEVVMTSETHVVLRHSRWSEEVVLILHLVQADVIDYTAEDLRRIGMGLTKSKYIDTNWRHNFDDGTIISDLEEGGM